MTTPIPGRWLEAIVSAATGIVRRYLAQRVGNRADVDDLSQEIYLRLLRIERKDLIRSPEALLFRMAANATHEWRLLARNRLPHSAAELGGLESNEGDPGAATWRSEIARELTNALAHLSPKCRAAVVLHRREHMTYSEIGVQLGLSVTMVKKYLAQGLALCREHLRARLGPAATEADE